MENWKDIKGYEGYYQINKLGIVRSLERVVAVREGSRNTSGYKTIKERIIKPQLSSLKNSFGGFRGRNKSDRPYYRVTLSVNSVVKKYYIHVLLYETFIGKILDGHVVDHIDNNSLNNSLDNLQILTHSENTIKEIDKSKTTSKYMYVYLNRKKNKWVCRYRGNRLYYGDNELDAKKAYDEYIKSIDG